MKKLLSLNNYHYKRGGSDAVFIEHDKVFQELGWETAKFAMHHENNNASQWAEYFVDEIEFGNSYSRLEKIKMAAKVIYSLEAKNKINLLIDHFKPDIVHSHCIYHHLSPSVLVAVKKHDIPSVMTAHDLKLACPAYKMLNENGVCESCKSGNFRSLLKNKCIHGSLLASALVYVESSVHKMLGLYKNNLDAIIAPSLFYKEKLVEWGWDESQIVYIPNYIDVADYEPDYNVGSYFLYFGRLALEKGIPTLMAAAESLGVKVVVVGTGPLESELIKNAPDNVSFVGYQTGNKLHNLIRGAKAVVLPSEWYENAPISLLEAYACGKPVIGANIGGIPELIIESHTGFLFESGVSESLTNVLSYVDNLPDSTINTIGKAAREYVSTKYTKKNYIDNTLALYKQFGV